MVDKKAEVAGAGCVMLCMIGLLPVILVLLWLVVVVSQSVIPD